MSQTPTRFSVVEEARSWVGTPYHRKVAIKGVGVDCGMLAYAVYRKFNLIPEFEPEWLANDWFAHATQERYLLMVQKYLRKLLETQARISTAPELAPGNLAVVLLSGSARFNHAGIITRWPRLVHAVQNRTSEIDASQNVFWAGKKIMVYDIGVAA